ncbi:MAG: ribosome biogenesis GTPase YlqF [SAR324 cluster bacterium]|nr:ribosome biogenesis GTPase YlqF [SAR324 cluster bacterium]
MKNPKEFVQENPINWYPGHMLKAKKELTARLKQVDVVLELRDARIPMASVNKDFEEILKQKKRIVLLNKTGLADEDITKSWRAYFKKNKIACHFMDVKKNQGMQQILPIARSMMQEKWQRFQKKGIRPPALKLMIVGIPNVGKSSLINKLVKRHAAATGPNPGVTQRQEWVRLGKDVELLDTPGILWPKFENPETGMALAITGAIKDRITGEERLCHFLIQYHIHHYPRILQTYYQLNDGCSTPEETLASIGQKRGCLKTGGEVDIPRTAKLLLRDFRAGKLGRVSFEKPKEESVSRGMTKADRD